MPVPQAFYVLGGYLIAEPTRRLLENIVDSIDESLHNKIIISRERNVRCCLAIMENLKELGFNKHLTGFDGTSELNYRIANGKYRFSTKWGRVVIKITDEEITLFNFVVTGCTPDDLRLFMHSIYTKYASTKKMNIFYVSKGNRWSFGNFRDQRKINVNNMTKDMRAVLIDVELFRSKETEKTYSEKGYPYRKGYCLQGVSGTGKGTVIEAVATKYGLPVYNVCLNSEEMTDSVLISLFTEVPRNSIICLDELDLQLETLRKNDNNKVSMGGLLSALDGPQRLNHGVIVFITTNQPNFLQDVKGKNYEEAFFRKGRIDTRYTFTEKIGSNFQKKAKIC